MGVVEIEADHDDGYGLARTMRMEAGKIDMRREGCGDRS